MLLKFEILLQSVQVSREYEISKFILDTNSFHPLFIHTLLSTARKKIVKFYHGEISLPFHNPVNSLSFLHPVYCYELLPLLFRIERETKKQFSSELSFQKFSTSPTNARLRSLSSVLTEFLHRTPNRIVICEENWDVDCCYEQQEQTRRKATNIQRKMCWGENIKKQQRWRRHIGLISKDWTMENWKFSFLSSSS